MTTPQVTGSVIVTVNGTALPGGARVRTVRVASRFNTPTQCEVSLHHPAGTGSWPAGIPLGSRLSVSVTGEDAGLFDGEVTCVELGRGPDGTPVSRVRAYDRSHRLRKRQTLRVFESVTAADVAGNLTADLDLRVAADPDAGPRLARVTQHRQSDFDLLTQVASRTGQLVAMDGDTVRLCTLDGFGTPVPLRYGQSLFEVAVEANLDRVARSVTGFGWDTVRAQPLRARADDARCGRRVPLEVAASTAGVDGDRSLVEQPAASTDELGAVAQLALDRRVASTVTVRGVAAGDSRLRAGVRVDLAGITSTVDGCHVLCEVVHTVDGNGYRSAFSTEPPAPHTPQPGAIVTLGRVTSVRDPQDLGRVRVCLPGFGDLDAGWLGVVCPGAGRGKGLVALPDVDDLVAVALPHADPDGGLVLGSLYGAVKPPDPGVSGDQVRRWSLRTDAGQAIVVDDERHSLRLENKPGSFVELAPGTVRLHSETDLVIEAVGHAITVRASSVDFEHA